MIRNLFIVRKKIIAVIKKDRADIYKKIEEGMIKNIRKKETIIIIYKEKNFRYKCLTAMLIPFKIIRRVKIIKIKI